MKLPGPQLKIIPIIDLQQEMLSRSLLIANLEMKCQDIHSRLTLNQETKLQEIHNPHIANQEMKRPDIHNRLIMSREMKAGLHIHLRLNRDPTHQAPHLIMVEVATAGLLVEAAQAQGEVPGDKTLKI